MKEVDKIVNENAVNTNSKEFEENAKVLLTSIEKDSKDLLEKASKTYKKDNNFFAKYARKYKENNSKRGGFFLSLTK